MTVKLIIAVDKDDTIGWKDGRLPWKLPEDLKRFKELTTGSTVVMGSNTYRSLGRPLGLPNRMNVVVSNQSLSMPAGIKLVSGLDWIKDHGNLWVIGGAQVYAEAIEKELIDELYVTKVHVNSGADVTLSFDLYDTAAFLAKQRTFGINWEVVDMKPVLSTVNQMALTFITFKKTKCG